MITQLSKRIHTGKNTTFNIEQIKKDFVHFDYEFYKKTYNDLEKANITTKEDCFKHYLLCGLKEGRSCCEKEIVDKYNKNKEKALYQIENYPKMERIKFHILIRTSNRPNYFKECIQSILSQNYDLYEVYICYDKKESLTYLEEYKDHPKINFFYIEIESNEKYKFNLYCNKLLEKVETGYVMFLDDDDIYLGNRTFEIINEELKNKDLLLCWKFLRPDKMIFPKNDQTLALGDIDTSSVCFHHSLKHFSKWHDKQYGDFHFFEPIFRECKKKKYINLCLTSTQFNNKIGNYGENV